MKNKNLLLLVLLTALVTFTGCVKITFTPFEVSEKSKETETSRRSITTVETTRNVEQEDVFKEDYDISENYADSNTYKENVKNSKVATDGFIAYDQEGVIDFLGEEPVHLSNYVGDNDCLYGFKVTIDHDIKDSVLNDDGVLYTDITYNDNMYLCVVGIADNSTADAIDIYYAEDHEVTLIGKVSSGNATLPDGTSVPVFMPLIAGSVENGYYLMKPSFELMAAISDDAVFLSNIVIELPDKPVGRKVN